MEPLKPNLIRKVRKLKQIPPLESMEKKVESIPVPQIIA